MTNFKERALGCLYGQAIGDALGLGTEFLPKKDVQKTYPHGLKRYEQIIRDNHRKRWPVGAWTDDTDMMLCILRAFFQGTIDVHKVAENFKDWFNGEPMGIGSHTFKVLSMTDYVEKPEQCSELWWKLSHGQSAANGALMRTSVIGLLPQNYIELTEQICELTHFDPRCVGSCVIVTEIIHHLLYSDIHLSVDEIIAIGNNYDDRIKSYVELAYNSTDISALELDEKFSIGYTLRTLSAALWSYFHSPDFESGLLAVVNEGGDADTNAAVASSILGAKFGMNNIPEYYITHLHNTALYHTITEDFVERLISDNQN